MLPLEKLSSMVTISSPSRGCASAAGSTGPGRVPSHRHNGIAIAAVMPTAFQ